MRKWIGLWCLFQQAKDKNIPTYTALLFPLNVEPNSRDSLVSKLDIDWSKAKEKGLQHTRLGLYIVGVIEFLTAISNNKLTLESIIILKDNDPCFFDVVVAVAVLFA